MEVWRDKGSKVDEKIPSIVLPERKYEKYALNLFRLICILLVIWMSVTQILKYLANEDKASVSYKKFHDSPIDRYPTYTICFSIKNNNWGSGNFYNNTYLTDEHNLTNFDYLNILWGDNLFRTQGKNQVVKSYNDTDVSKIDFEKAAKHPIDVMSDYFVGYNTGLHLKTGRKKMRTVFIDRSRSWVNPEEFEIQMTTAKIYLNNDDYRSSFSKIFPFYKSYQDAERICLTRRDEYRNKVTRDFEHLTHWTWKENYFQKISIYIHHPNQGMRLFFQKFQSKTLTDRNTQKLTSQDFNNMRFSINHVSVLRKRPDSNQPCDSGQNDDEKMFAAIFKIIPCVPPFWKIFQPEKHQKPECRNEFEIQEVMKKVKEQQWGDATPFIKPPCDKMTISSNIERTKTNPEHADKLMVLRFQYVTEDYQEIVNVLDFGVEAFWSSIGGFMGIFLGYSCLQVAEFILDRVHIARKSFFK